MKLIQVGEKTYYIEGDTNVGVYKTGPDSVCLIDTGSWGFGEKLDELIKAMHWKVDYIINTHSHIDHLGGNQYLMKKYGIPAYMADIEIPFAHYSDLEISYMHGGRPCSQLRNIFVHPGKIGFRSIEDVKVCGMECTPVDAVGGTQLLDGLSWIYLPGHTFGMIGVKTDDDVWFLGDAYLSRAYMKKRSFGYLCDLGAYLDTFDMLAELDGELFIPSHGIAENNISEILELNRKNVYEVIREIRMACAGFASLDEIVRKMYEFFGLKNNIANHALLSSTIKSYLTYLQDRGELECTFCDNVLVWKCVQ